MKQYHIWTIGCQMNHADSIRIGSALEQTGYSYTEQVDNADLIILNTCSVRQRAEDSAQGKLGSLVPLKKKNKDLVVAVTGCMVPPQEEGKRPLYKRFPMVDLFFDTLDPQSLVEILPDPGCAPEVEPALAKGGTGLTIQNKIGVTAFVSVIYGCNYTCSYCIVPLRRGKEMSRPVDEIVNEIKGYVKRGVREVTLLGQTIDAYGHDLQGRPDLADLFYAVHQIEGLWRIRFLTSHPKMMSYKMIKAVADLPKVCEYFNLPVQAGDNAILKAMKRPYTVEFYEKLAATVRETVPGTALSTDIIVGFPGETDEQFQHTYELLERIRFNEVHVAAYSPRPGTLADKYEDNVPLEVKRERLQAIEKLQERVSHGYTQAFVGQDVEILVESREKGKWKGRSRTNKPVFFDSPTGPEYDGLDWIGKLVDVTIETAGPWSLVGRVAGTPPVRKGRLLPVFNRDTGSACEVELPLSIASK
jgi:tRNA-2-methylthio-N6-dimethylallyladenosine synthase